MQPDMRDRSHRDTSGRKLQANLAPTLPSNIWTREEFEAWISKNLNEALSERHPSAPPATKQEIAALAQRMVTQVNYAIIPAGNG
jgi:hypothetical protein